MKKYIIPVAMLSAMTTFTSCDDVVDCGCECSRPVVTRIEQLDQPGVDLSVDSLTGGVSVVVMGSNLGNVTAVTFDGKDAALKPAYRTDNTLVFTVPKVTRSCSAIFYTESCPTGYSFSNFNVKVGAPEIYMVNNEFAADGTMLKLRGANFLNDQIYIGFNGISGEKVWKRIPSYEERVAANNVGEGIINEEGTEAWVIVPEGIQESTPIYMENKNLGKSSTSQIIFRDTRNMLIDFEGDRLAADGVTKLLDYTLATGVVAKDAVANYDVYSGDLTGIAATVPAIYPGTASRPNQFGYFNGKDWTGIQYLPGQSGADGADETNVFGPFLADYSKCVIKFEVYVPKEHSVEGLALVVALGDVSADDWTAPRAHCAWLNMSEIEWDKTDESDWKKSSAKSFSTDEWITVTVPFSELRYAPKNGGYGTSAFNLSNNLMADVKMELIYGDPKNQLNYIDYCISEYGVTADDPMFFGGLHILFDSYDTAIEDKDHFFAVDNVRIVPNDGNGAIYPYTNFGKALQDYSSNPRKSAFK